jgi:hypothetical protein
MEDKMGKERPARLGPVNAGIAIRRPGAITNPEAVGRLLGGWKAQELRFAERVPAFRGLSKEDVEETFQGTTEALLPRAFENEEHLRNALRLGMRHRALNAHRDRSRRQEILYDSAPGMHAAAAQRALADGPENAARLREDRLTVTEFLTELTQEQQRMFWHEQEGLKYRAIAPLLAMDVNAARRMSRAIEQKRERFQVLYDSGRLCNFRASTIEALQRKESTSEELYKRALAHLAHCTLCRDAHRTNAARLRAAFQEHANALLPVPALAVGARMRMFLYRLLPGWVPGGTDAMREGLVGIAAGAGVGAKVAGTLAAAAIAAGGSLAASGALDHDGARHRAHQGGTRARQAAALRARPSEQAPASETNASESTTSSGASRNATERARARRARRSEQTGFDYLGVPSKGSGSEGAQTARVASSNATARATPSKQGAANEFSP